MAPERPGNAGCPPALEMMRPTWSPPGRWHRSPLHAPLPTHTPVPWPGRAAGLLHLLGSSLPCRVARAGPQSGTSLLSLPCGHVIRTDIWVWAQLAQPQPCARPQLASILSTRIWSPSSFHSKLLCVLISSYHSSVVCFPQNLRRKRNCGKKQHSGIPGVPDLGTTRTTRQFVKLCTQYFSCSPTCFDVMLESKCHDVFFSFMNSSQIQVGSLRVKMSS